MKIENVKVYGIVDALRGMRNPLNSWAKNDSTSDCAPDDGRILSVRIGPNDEALAKTLIRGGQPHRKFLRQIPVVMDVTAPAYWWAEMDTYKVSTTRNSCSVQHKGASRPFTRDDFALDGKEDDGVETAELLNIIDVLNKYRSLYVQTKDYRYFRIMRQLMPMGYEYRATWSGNYETLLNIWEWRRNHKLKEWHEFCREVEKMPGMDVFLEK